MQEQVSRNPDGTWPTGQSGNPAGNNGRTPITDCLKVLLTREDDTYDDKPMNNAQQIALQWAKKAKAGELAAIVSLTDRVEGKAAQPFIPPPDPIAGVNSEQRMLDMALKIAFVLHQGVKVKGLTIDQPAREETNDLDANGQAANGSSSGG